MTIYLCEDFMGGSPDIIGFPNLISCMGVVLLTKNNMFGLHLVEKSTVPPYVDEFKKYLLAQDVKPADMVTLYGCCNFKNRYKSSDQAPWQEELRHIAGIIGFAKGGDAKGFDTAIVDKVAGAYVEYRRVPGADTCKVFYKRDSKMTYTKTGAKEIKILKKPTSTPYLRDTYSSAAIVYTDSNKGLLHDYGLKFKTFKI